MKSETMLTSIRVSAGKGAQHRRARAVGELERSEPRTRWTTKKGHENAFRRSGVLVE
jgi:hypothetical protein